MSRILRAKDVLIYMKEAIDVVVELCLVFIDHVELKGQIIQDSQRHIVPPSDHTLIQSPSYDHTAQFRIVTLIK